MRAVSEMRGVYKARFHQCAFGLVSPNGAPMLKPTIIMTNHPGLHAKFNNVFCKCKEPHRVIESSENGVKLSSFASVYPGIKRQTLPSHSLAGRSQRPTRPQMCLGLGAQLFLASQLPMCSRVFLLGPAGRATCGSFARACPEGTHPEWQRPSSTATSLSSQATRLRVKVDGVASVHGHLMLFRWLVVA